MICQRMLALREIDRLLIMPLWCTIAFAPLPITQLRLKFVWGGLLPHVLDLLKSKLVTGYILTPRLLTPLPIRCRISLLVVGLALIRRSR